MTLFVGDARSLTLEPRRLDKDAAAARTIFENGWKLLDSLPAHVIPGAANLRLPRFVGEEV